MCVCQDVDLEFIAAKAKNYTGAELEGLVRDAASFAMEKAQDPSDPTRAANPDSIRITMSDFMHALAEVRVCSAATLDTCSCCRLSICHSSLRTARVTVPCRAVPCRAVPCRAVPCRAVPCH
jgi:hypothetical protein